MYARLPSIPRAISLRLVLPMERLKSMMLKGNRLLEHLKDILIEYLHQLSLMGFYLQDLEIPKSLLMIHAHHIMLFLNFKDIVGKFVGSNMMHVDSHLEVMIIWQWFGILLLLKWGINFKGIKLLLKPLPGALGKEIFLPLEEVLQIKPWSSGTSKQENS